MADVLGRVRGAQDVTDLSVAPPSPADPGPVAGQPPTQPPTQAPAHVWYVSYGSNLLAERFEVYLLGGSVAGLDGSYPGGTTTAPASAERAVVLPGGLRFALDAPRWGGGGVAFWDPDGTGVGVLARAWRVRLEQYLEVVHLENGGTDRAAAPWPADLLRTGSELVGDGWYGRLVLAGHLEGEPALSFTHPRPSRLRTRAPSARYAAVVARGLVETFGPPARGGLGPAEADAYLRGAGQVGAGQVGAAYSEG